MDRMRLKLSTGSDATRVCEVLVRFSWRWTRTRSEIVGQLLSSFHRETAISMIFNIFDKKKPSDN